MTKGEKDNPLHTDEEGFDKEGKAVNIIKTSEIYCGRPTLGYRVVREGLNVIFTPNLDKVHVLIDEYYNGESPLPKSKEAH